MSAFENRAIWLFRFLRIVAGFRKWSRGSGSPFLCVGAPLLSLMAFCLVAQAQDAPQKPGDADEAEALLEKACKGILKKVEDLEKQGKTEEAMAALQASPVGRVLETWARLDRARVDKEFEMMGKFVEEIFQGKTSESDQEKTLARIDELKKTARNPVTLFILAWGRNMIRKDVENRKHSREGYAFLREGAETIDLGKEKVLILPCDAQGFEGIADETLLTPSMLADLASLFGRAGLSLDPILPVFEAAGLKLDANLVHAVVWFDEVVSQDTIAAKAALVPKRVFNLLTDKKAIQGGK